MISQLICHLVGDYILQSDWMANEKTKRWLPAVCHALAYGIPFVLLLAATTIPSSSWIASLAIIIGTHLLIDHYRLARHVGYIKNFLAPKDYWYPWAECNGTGYHNSRPAWLAVWLLIITDNTLHIVINALALAYFS